MSKYVGFAAMLLVCCCVIPAQSTICWVEPSDDFHDRMPLILKSSSDEFVYPNKCGSKSLRLTFIDDLRAACPGDSITVLGRDTNRAVSQLSCYGVTLFGLGGASYPAPFRKIRCNRVPDSEVQTTTETCGNGTISRIGFAISSSSFVPSIEQVCSDANQTHWTHHKVVPYLTKRNKLSILAGDDNSGEGFLGGWGTWFKRTTTTTTSTTTVASTEQVINTLLVPREDMFYRAQQDSTFNSLNNVPMYRSVRNGNWRLVEEIVRKLASAKRQCTTLDVWTGRYNGTNSTSESTTTTTPTTTAATTTTTTTTPATTTTTTTTTPATTSTTTTTAATTTTTISSNNRLKRQSQPTATSTPRFVFKVVVDEQHKRGIVFVTLNDPSVTAITPSEQLCAPYAQCSSLYPQFNVVSQGYTHCCTLADFADVATKLGMPTFTNYQPII